jgi:poly-beta-1,6-N-acetyl-D-glucosamine synthase
LTYVLITAARNESGYIEQTIESVLGQTVRPVRWAIVSDGSTDGTDDTVRSCAQAHPFITLLRMGDGAQRNFASQAYALNRAVAHVWPEPFDCIGCLDADIALAPDYYRRILDEFRDDPRLGVAGGFIHEQIGGRFEARTYNSERSVAGAVQMFRRACFEHVGTFTPVPHGGLDTIAELKARMAGYSVRSLPDVPVRHLRPTGAASGLLSGAFKAGLMEFEVGYHPLFELFVCARRFFGGVPFLSPMARLAGFLSAYLNRTRRMVSGEMMAFLRREQMDRLTAFFRRLGSRGRPGGAAPHDKRLQREGD